MLLGTFHYNVDSKGRLFIPVKLRVGSASKKETFILTRGLELCLYLYESGTFHRVLMAKLDALPVKNQRDGRAFKRLLLAGAQEVALDDMGRILLPKTLMDYAGLKKGVSILGVRERIELWATSRWISYSTKAAATFQRLGTQLEI